MKITRIVVFPIPTTDRWIVYRVQKWPDGSVISDWPDREQAVNNAREQGRHYHYDCPVVTYPEED
ncbi:Uncharacterised protein [Acidipropionibacterium jensenii]|uniref:DUF2188 domain-containing protein n=1 Tax=Acidipropionibacterium jensenii TaxID=1749 RepID=A0A3S4W9R0_9ACTN|nr:hypothetical protein [Acidipropionibacterium jensenii]VEI04124.1 Uncharacterised protein [Acidipropionibacterium jensenii]